MARKPTPPPARFSSPPPALAKRGPAGSSPTARAPVPPPPRPIAVQAHPATNRTMPPAPQTRYAPGAAQAKTARSWGPRHAPPPCAAIRSPADSTASRVLQGFFRGPSRWGGNVVQAKDSSPARNDAYALPATFALPQGAGRQLPDAVRQKMEAHFGSDFSGVRVHVGPEAPAIGALAFTMGNTIVFAPGQYNPESPRGQQLLGHELAHVVQQRAGRVRNPFGRGLAVVQDAGLEAEADRMGMRAATAPLRPGPAARSSDSRAAGGIQRKIDKISETYRNIDLAANYAKLQETNGYTPPKINNAVYADQGGHQWMTLALLPPAIQVDHIEDQFIATVTNVPTNQVGYRMYLPMPGPWVASGNKDMLLAYYCNSDWENNHDNVDIQVTSKNGDEVLARKIQDHEQVHADDIMRAYDEILIPWDRNLQRMLTERTQFVGISEQDAKDKLFTAAGGTVDEVCRRLMDRFNVDSSAFHQSDRGKTTSHGAIFHRDRNLIVKYIDLTVDDRGCVIF